MLTSTFRHIGGNLGRVITQCRSSSQSPGAGCFKGVRIVDMSSGLAGPFFTQLFGDMGAEVIKIEQPGSGDESREWGPAFIGGESCFFMSTNRNKKGVAIDVTNKKGRQIIKDLVIKSDVFVGSNTAVKGLDFKTLNALNPRLIYATITGSGSNVGDAGYDLVASAVGGLMSITGPEDGSPCAAGVLVTEMITSMYLHGSVSAALYEREQTKRGKHVHCSLLEVQAACLSHIATNYLNVGIVGQRHGSGHGTVVPYQAFDTKDGVEIVIGVTNEKFFKATCQVVGLEHIPEDKRFRTNANRLEHRKQLITLLQERLTKEPSLHWIECLRNVGVPCARVNRIPDVFDLPQVKALGQIQSIHHPQVGSIKVPGPAIEFENQPFALATHPPQIGEDTKTVLKHVLSYEDDYVEQLLHDKVVMQWRKGET